MAFSFVTTSLTVNLKFSSAMKRFILTRFIINPCVSFLIYNFLGGQLYFIRDLHLQDFGFPRVREQQTQTSYVQFGKRFKWKKINYKTLLPKHAHIVAYLVAKTNNYQNQQFMMHAAAHANEFNINYTQTAFTK